MNKFLYILFVPNASFEVHPLNSIENLGKLITELSLVAISFQACNERSSEYLCFISREVSVLDIKKDGTVYRVLYQEPREDDDPLGTTERPRAPIVVEC